jgi:hypothetical protein
MAFVGVAAALTCQAPTPAAIAKAPIAALVIQFLVLNIRIFPQLEFDEVQPSPWDDPRFVAAALDADQVTARETKKAGQVTLAGLVIRLGVEP